ncbi:MAG: flagellar protein FlaG [Candidatus Poribacteria bacterium]
MDIQSLAISGADKAPPKTKAIYSQDIKDIQEPKLSANIERKEDEQSDNIKLKALTEAISDSAGINISMARLSFTKDEETGDIVIKIIDNETNEVIKQIPPEELENLRKRLGDILGLILDKKA